MLTSILAYWHTKTLLAKHLSQINIEKYLMIQISTIDQMVLTDIVELLFSSYLW